MNVISQKNKQKRVNNANEYCAVCHNTCDLLICDVIRACDMMREFDMFQTQVLRPCFAECLCIQLLASARHWPGWSTAPSPSSSLSSDSPQGWPETQTDSSGGYIFHNRSSCDMLTLIMLSTGAVHKQCHQFFLTFLPLPFLTLPLFHI